MPLSPGKYDELATYVREQSIATAVILLIIDGDKGSGFSIQGSAEMTLRLPELLRHIASEIENSLRA